jgi:UDP-N-acetylglucosamine 2-epimerase (non-hydrolysing)
MLSKNTIDIIAGARPNFVKIASIINAINDNAAYKDKINYRLIHTGQHYDPALSDVFFQQLNIPSPDINLEVGSGSQAVQTAEIMVKYEKILGDGLTSMCLVVGDVNSTMACAIAAQKMKVQVAHVEAGIRSHDWSMPEEINRLVTDSITNWFFTTSEIASNNLIKSGIDSNRIFFVGNTMIDTLYSNLHRLCKPKFFDKLSLIESHYFVITLHRPSNVDKSADFIKLLHAISEGLKGLPAVFPLHPRTAKTLTQNISLPKNILIVEPQPYLEFNYLVKNSKGVITDSGGITEETTVMGIPCITLRNTTERPETVSIGTNMLVGNNIDLLIDALHNIILGNWKKGKIPELWDGKAGTRIVSEIKNILKIKEHLDRE